MKEATVIEKRAPSDSVPIHRHRRVLWLGVFALLLSLLGPVIAIQSTAAQENLAQRLQGEPPDCDPGFVVDEATNTCVVDPAAQQQEEQQQEEEQQQQEEQQQEEQQQEEQQLQCAEGEILDETGTVCIPDPALQEVEPAYIQIDKYDCPEGEDWSEPDYQQLAGGCPANQTPVNMTVNGELQSITSTGTWGPYEAPAAYNMNEEERAGYEMPHWFCGSPEAAPTYVGTMYGVSGQVPEGESLYCQVFNYQQADEYSEILIEKYWCPEGYVPQGTESQADMMAACQDSGPGTTFDLQGGGQQWPQGMVPGQPGGTAYWDQLPQDTYTITESGLGPDWYAQVYCHEAPLLSNGVPSDPQLQQMMGDGKSIQWSSQPNYLYACSWFNILEDEYNYVDFYKYECLTAAPEGADLDWYVENCTPVEGWEFDLQFVGGGSTETTDASGYASWSGLPMGTWQASETLPEGYADPVVWCRYVEWPDDVVTGNWAMFEAPGGAYENGFGYDGMRMECYWYNFPPGEYNYVDLYKYECPTEAPEGAGPDWYAENCTPVEGWNFNVGYEGGGSSQETDASGNASWSGVPTGAWNMSESVPEGYGEPVIWCRYVEWPEGSGETGDWTMYTPQEGYYESTFEEGNWHIECYWYNFPPEGEYILELNKYLCPADVDPTLGLPDLGTSCMPIEGVSFTASFGATPGSARYTDMNGQILWTDAPLGAWSLQETTVPGWGPPKVYCGPTETTEAPEVPVVDLAVSGTLSSMSPHIVCSWFNFELEYDDGRITIYKYQCPPGTTSTDLGILQESCVTPFNGLGFTLQTGDMVSSASTVGGTVDWYNLGQGSYTVTEQPLPGYAQPLVWCGYVTQDGVDIDPGNQQFDSYPVTEGAIQLELNNFPARIVCYWYNFPTDPGEITIYKWLCPPGYDIGAWGADPTVDCITPYNGVTFTLDQPQGVDQMTDTGDSVPGAVYFGGLNPGAYTVTETVPPDIQYVFVLDCVGNNIPKVHPYPLSWGNKLNVNVASGDEIVCNWYNVPHPEFGWLTVYKYQCWTKTFTKHVDCEIYEHGASFELFGYPSQTSYGVGTTNNGGRYTWYDLQPGAYTLSEFSHTPCKITSTKTDGQGHAQVDTGQETVIRVYNCSTPTTPTPTSTPTTPTPGTTPTPTPSTTTTTTTTTSPKAPGKVPGKFPNTGVDPNQAQDFMPAVAALQDDPEGTPQDDELVDAYYRISCLDEPLEPLGTPTEEATDPDEAAVMATEEPEEFDLDFEIEDEDAAEGDLEATPGDEEDCPRGALPERVVVEAASVDAGVETLEIIDGIMEQPTGPELVTWYKETGRLGENNNVVIAGHLNWWNVPEGVFYRLQDLQEGDRVEITGDDGRIYVYEVEWVRQESNLEPPAPEVVGPTDDPTLTLITCGGEWNADVAEYDERTVARAVQVDVLEPEATADGAAAYTRLLAA
jgi:sortase (surface protein transpeptidase)